MHSSRGASARAAFLINVHGVVFELVVEAHVVHSLEDFVPCRLGNDRSVASSTYERFGHVDSLPQVVPDIGI